MTKLHIVLTAIAVMALSACGVNPQKATSALEAQGYTDVKIGGYSFWGCGDKDDFRSSFTATGVNGKPVEGVVCASWLKGITIRSW